MVVKILEWIYENVKWIFSGVGNPFLYKFYKVLRKIFDKKKKENFELNQVSMIKEKNKWLSDKDIENWKNLYSFFYTSGLLKKVYNFNFGVSYSEDYFYVNGKSGADFLMEIEEDPLPYFDDEELQKYFSYFSENYQKAIDLLCYSYFADRKPGYMTINENYKGDIVYRKSEDFSYYKCELNKSFNKLYKIIKRKTSLYN